MSARPPEAGPAAHPALEPLFAAALPAARALLDEAEAYAQDFARIAAGGPGLIGAVPVRFGQEWFPRLDAVAAYAMVRRARPARMLEVGSGHSTRFLAQALHDGGIAASFTCVDPQPRAPIAGLPLRHERRPFGEADVDTLRAFGPGDILFVDSSHVATPASELGRIVLDVLPGLPAGTLLHLHDIFLPEGYPAAWTGRGYNESVVAGALLGGGAWEIVFPSRYVATRTGLLADRLVEGLPLVAGAFECSLWLRRR